MRKIEKDYQDHHRWVAGSRQEVIADAGEGLAEAIEFMKTHLKYFNHDKLTFSKDDIEINGNRYYFTLRERKTSQVVKQIMTEEHFTGLPAMKESKQGYDSVYPELDESANYELEQKVIRRKQALLSLDLAAEPATPEYVWQVSAGHVDTFTPCACFSQKTYAYVLFHILDTDYEPRQVKVENNILEVDRFLPLIKAGKQPFFLTMFRDFSVLEKAEDASDMAEPQVGFGRIYDKALQRIVNQEKAFIFGTFWADHSFDAYKVAEDCVRDFIAHGKL